MLLVNPPTIVPVHVKPGMSKFERNRDGVDVTFEIAFVATSWPDRIVVLLVDVNIGE